MTMRPAIKIIITSLFVVASILIFFSFAHSAFAQGNTGTTLINPLGAGADIFTLLNSIMDLVIKIGGIIVILMLVYVGYLFVIAQGKEGEITKAREALFWTIVGALILLGSKAISIGIVATVNALKVP